MTAQSRVALTERRKAQSVPACMHVRTCRRNPKSYKYTFSLLTTMSTFMTTTFALPMLVVNPGAHWWWHHSGAGPPAARPLVQAPLGCASLPMRHPPLLKPALGVLQAILAPARGRAGFTATAASWKRAIPRPAEPPVSSVHSSQRTVQSVPNGPTAPPAATAASPHLSSVRQAAPAGSLLLWQARRLSWLGRAVRLSVSSYHLLFS